MKFTRICALLTIMLALAVPGRVYAQAALPVAPAAPVAKPAATPGRSAIPAAEHMQRVRALIERDPTVIERSYPAAALVLARREAEREQGIHFPELVRGSPRDPQVALTFDDGPHPVFTLKLLEILKREHVPATFFVVGKQVDAHASLVLREVVEGHEVANHTYHHLRLASVPRDLIEPELVEGARAIKRAIGTTPRLYRPPGGEYNADVIAVTKKLDYVMVLWTDDPGDFANPGSGVIEKRTLREVSNGGIILLHDGVQQTLDILPDLIHRLRQRGFRFVTCSEMALQGGALKTGGPTVIPLTQHVSTWPMPSH